LPERGAGGAHQVQKGRSRGVGAEREAACRIEIVRSANNRKQGFPQRIVGAEQMEQSRVALVEQRHGLEGKPSARQGQFLALLGCPLVGWGSLLVPGHVAPLALNLSSSRCVLRANDNKIALAGRTICTLGQSIVSGDASARSPRSEDGQKSEHSLAG